jgi:hypothetical protein
MKRSFVCGIEVDQSDGGAGCQVPAEGVGKEFWRSDRATMIRLGAFMDNIDSR